MESTNNNHLHHLQHQASSFSAPSSSYAHSHVGGTTHSWTPNITLNAGNFTQNLQDTDPRSRGLTHKKDSMIQDLGYLNNYHWMSKDEISGFPPKFSEMLNSSPSSSLEGYDIQLPSTTQMKSEHRDNMNEKLLNSAHQSYNPNFSTGTTSRGNFSQIYPSINISPTYSTSVSSSSFDMTTQRHSLDLLTSSPGSYLSHLSQDHDLGTFTDNLSFSLHHMQHPSHRSSCSNSTNPSHFTNGAAETKRPGTLMESMVSQSQTASKKSRLESRPPCQPLKVRKEKLGDRIAALQQLVAPFGKTDTASVLMEAIGYIKFLQGQVETLSVPYMKPSQNQTNRAMQGGTATGEEANAEAKQQDLRSRGLCLVPLSCMSFIAGDGSIEMWQQPNFG